MTFNHNRHLVPSRARKNQLIHQAGATNVVKIDGSVLTI